MGEIEKYSIMVGVIMLTLFLCVIGTTKVIDQCSKEIIEKEPKQQTIFLTFDQRVAHMKKCFDAAEEITTLGWGKSTGLIAIQLYLDTIDDLSEDKTITLGPYLKSVQERLKND